MSEGGYTIRKKNKLLIAAIAAVVIVILITAAFVVAGNSFPIKNVSIAGPNRDNVWTVYQLSGLDSSVNYFQVSEERIRNGINSDYRFAYQGMEKIWPDTVVLYVAERTPELNIFSQGQQFITSRDGVVLESTGSINYDNGLIRLDGLSIRDIRVGSSVTCMDEGQFGDVIAVLDELEAQGWKSDIVELDVAMPESITMTTYDGYTIKIGNTQQIRGKLGTVCAVLVEVRARGLQGGTIEATVPGEASYLPA